MVRPCGKKNDRIGKRMYVRECGGSRSIGGPQKRWIDTVKDCLKQEVWMSGKQTEWYMIRVNGGSL